MGTARLALKRSRRRWGLLACIAALAAILAGLLPYTVGTVEADTGTAIERMLAQGPPTAAAVSVQSLLADDVPAAGSLVGELIEDRFDTVAVTADRSVWARPLDIVGAERSEAAQVLVAAIPALADRAELVDGEWPAAAAATVPITSVPIPAALHATAAALLGVEVGDVLRLGGDGSTGDSAREFEVVATWLPEDAGAAIWFGEPSVASGIADGAAGPLVIAENDLTELPGRIFSRWTVVPELTAPDALPALAAALAGFDDAVSGLGGSHSLSGTLADRVAEAQRALGSAAGLLAVPLVLVALVGLVAFAQASQLLAAARRAETMLLRARGASVAQLTAVCTAEVAIVASVGAGLGGAAGAVTGTADWRIAAAVVLAAVLVAAVSSARAAAGAGRVVARREGGTVAVPMLVAAVIAVGAAALSVGQLLLYGSPLVAGVDGELRVDPLIVPAPALSLLAISLLAALAFGPAVAAGERLAARRPGLLPVLPARQLARRASVFGIALLMVALSAGGATFAAAHSASWATASQRQAQLDTGGDLRVALDRPTEGPELRERIETLEGVTAVAGVFATGATIDRTAASFLSIDADALPAVMTTAGGSVDTAGLARALQNAEEVTGVIVTSALARHLAAGPGDRLALFLPGIGATVDLRVASVVEAIPGTDSYGLLVDSTQLDEQLREGGSRPATPGELWIAADEAQQLVPAVEEAAHQRVVVTTAQSYSTASIAAPAVDALWWGAGGLAVIAAITVAGAAAMLSATRRGEAVVLRALGLGATQQGRARGMELGLVLAGALLGGIIAGVVTSLLVTPALSGATPSGVAADFAWLPWAILMTMLAAALSVIVLLLARSVRRQALDAVRPEDAQ